MFDALFKYKKKSGNCNVPRNWPDNAQLATWVGYQRQKKDWLSQDRIQRLNDLGFVWEPRDAFWEEMFEAFVKYKKETGNCNVPINWSENPSLGVWVDTQRQNKDHLTPDRIQRLNDLGFVWEPYEAFWEEMFQALVEYKKKTGNCNVPQKWPENPPLGVWASTQRRRKDRLTPDRIKRLNKLGFVWKPIKELWDEMFDAFVKYKKKNGNCNVPSRWPENPQLATWVSTQRQKKDRLTPDRIKRLNNLGFVWEPIKVLWDEMFQALVGYKKRTGNCNVPFKWPKNPPLGIWVFTQRQKKDRLTPDRIKRLNNIGFVWEPFEAFWEEMFEALVEYKKRTGNCNVPDNWPENPQLGSWVGRQRHEKNRLLQDRIRRLNDLGIVWEL